MEDLLGIMGSNHFAPEATYGLPEIITIMISSAPLTDQGHSVSESRERNAAVADEKHL